LFGFRYLAPQVGAGTPNLTHNGYAVTNSAGNLVDLDGNEIRNSFANQPGFPGFSPTASQSLAMLSDMQEAGVPVTYGYISDLHERKAGTSGCTTASATSSGAALGPGDSCYVQNVKAYDAAFATFFKRLAADGITPANTEFVITAEENDHFAGANATRASQPTPAGCDGVTTPCSYATNQIGELNSNLQGLAAAQGYTGTQFDVEPQGAAVYVHGQPGPTDPNVRALERAVANATADNPYSGRTGEHVAQWQAGAEEQRILHIESADPLRTPTFTVFPKPDYYFGASSCTPSCVSILSRFAWNHGYYSPDIDITWAGFAGPNIARHGVDGPAEPDGSAVQAPNGDGPVTDYSAFGTWTDETDVRPTLLSLAGLHDDYTSDGRVISELLQHTPKSVQAVTALGTCYKQVYASVGQFGTDTLTAETKALASGSATDDQQYTKFEKRLALLGTARDALANQIKKTLEDAEFTGVTPSAKTLFAETTACNALLYGASLLANS
jgi:hypothetical protein